MLSLDAVVFDLDGTLVDTAPDLHAHLNELLARLGRPPMALAEMRPLIGDGARTLVRRGLEASGGPGGHDLDVLFAEFLSRYTRAPQRFGGAFAGVFMALEHLTAARIALGVCTNKAQAPTDRLLGALDLDRYFPVVVGGDALPVKKPDAGHVRAVLDGLGVLGGRAVMVGDSRNDLEAARAAGLPCVLVSFGYTEVPARELGADRVIDHFDELLPVLAELAGSA